MNVQRDPPRWKLQTCADPTLRRALRAASRERPSKADVSWMESALSARIGLAASGQREAAGHAPPSRFSPAPPVPRSSQLTPLLGKVLGVLVVGAATVGGGLWASRTISVPAPLAALRDPAPASAADNASEVARVIAVSELRYDRAGVPAARVVEPRVQPTRLRERTKPRSAVPDADEQALSALDDRPPAKTAVDDGSPSKSAANDDRAPAKPPAVDDRALAKPSPEEAPPAPAAAKELSEIEVLMAARRSLASDPAAALGWVRQHERSFAAPVLAEEREIIAIEALRRLNRTAEANARRKRFYARYPASIHGRSIETSAASAPAAGTAVTSPHAQR